MGGAVSSSKYSRDSQSTKEKPTDNSAVNTNVEKVAELLNGVGLKHADSAQDLTKTHTPRDPAAFANDPYRGLIARGDSISSIFHSTDSFASTRPPFSPTELSPRERDAPEEEKVKVDPESIKQQEERAEWWYGLQRAKTNAIERLQVQKMLQDTVPTKGGICRRNISIRSQFIVLCWEPFLKDLAKLKETIEYRVSKRYAEESRFPLRGRDIVKLLDQNLKLTQLWYGEGRGNVNQVYAWFIDAMELCGVPAYLARNVPTVASADNWIRVVDRNVRQGFLKQIGQRDRHLAALGNISQKQGESAIDNTTLCNIFHPVDAKVLLVQRILRRFLLSVISIRQRKWLRIVKGFMGVDLLALKPKLVISLLSNVTEKDLDRMRINPGNLSWRALCEKGAAIADWGQVPETDKLAWAGYISNIVRENFEVEAEAKLDRCSPAPTARRSFDEERTGDEFHAFINWSKAHPGQFFRSREHHIVTLIAGMWCNKVAVVKRTQMEKLTHAKYLPVPWVRQVDLVRGSGEAVVRPAGSRECSRLRINECPYAALHGMALAPGGIGEKHHKKVNIHYEMCLPEDPKARLSNWDLCDIEKICCEAKLLNPCIGDVVLPPEERIDKYSPAPNKTKRNSFSQKAMRKEVSLGDLASAVSELESLPDMCNGTVLPGERCINVGQNPKIASSIGPTQHTQVWAGSLQDYPLFLLEESPRKEPFLQGGTLDVCSAGYHSDACFIKVLCRDPTVPAVTRFLIALRLELLRVFGGPEQVDFLVKAMGDGRGAFAVIMCPIAQMQKGEGGIDGGHNVNCTLPLEEQQQEYHQTPKGFCGAPEGEGLWMLDKEDDRHMAMTEGEHCMRKMYSFCRIPGARKAVDTFIGKWRREEKRLSVMIRGDDVAEPTPSPSEGVNELLAEGEAVLAGL